MTRVVDVLREASSSSLNLGNSLSTQAILGLRGLRRQNLAVVVALSMILLIGLVVVFVLAFRGFSLAGYDSKAIVGGGLVLLALLVLLCAEWLRRAWREHSEASVLLILLENCDEATVRQIVRVLTKAPAGGDGF